MNLKDIMEHISIVDSIGAITGLLTILGVGYKTANFFYQKLNSAIMENRAHNEKITNEVKQELIAHMRDDDRRLAEVSANFKDLFNVSNRTDEKVTLLINNKIKN